VRWTLLLLFACSAAPTVKLPSSVGPVAARPSHGCFSKPPAPVVGDRRLTSGGHTRRFRLVLPDPLPAQPMPLVLNIHGLVESPAIQEWYSRMDEPARARGVALVYPQGVGNSWNAGACCGRAQSEATQDVRFFRDLVREVSDEICVDLNRVFATGMSNGAMMAYRLACEAPDLFAAVAPVAGVDALPKCDSKTPVPVLAFNGTNDPLVHYGGGWFGLISVDETLAHWTARNRCTGTIPSVVYSSADTQCTAATGCAADTIFCKVEGRGHTWPGAALPILGMGGTTSAVDATSTILDFLLAHPKSG
jgi:polyhydroxybutyrate depolymerase